MPRHAADRSIVVHVIRCRFVVERPLVRFDETMSVERGMCFAIHPGVHTFSAFINLCDNYLVRDDGASECLHKTEKRVFEIQQRIARSPESQS